MIKKINHAYSELYKSKNSCVVDFLPGYVLLLPSHTALSCFRVKIRENTAVYRLQSTDYDGKRQNICPRKAKASADSRPYDSDRHVPFF